MNIWKFMELKKEPSHGCFERATNYVMFERNDYIQGEK